MAHAITLALLAGVATVAAAQTTPRNFLDAYCVSCHNQKLQSGGLALDSIDATAPERHAETWERVIAKLRAGSMPPPGLPRPDSTVYRAIATTLESQIDRAWAADPNPGRISAVHRLNRAEYNNAIRDLFALDIDVKPLLPAMKPLTAASTTSRVRCRSRPLIWSVTFPWHGT